MAGLDPQYPSGLLVLWCLCLILNPGATAFDKSHTVSIRTCAHEPGQGLPGYTRHASVPCPCPGQPSAPCECQLLQWPQTRIWVSLAQQDCCEQPRLKHTALLSGNSSLENSHGDHWAHSTSCPPLSIELLCFLLTTLEHSRLRHSVGLRSGLLQKDQSVNQLEQQVEVLLGNNSLLTWVYFRKKGKRD